MLVPPAKLTPHTPFDTLMMYASRPVHLRTGSAYTALELSDDRARGGLGSSLTRGLSVGRRRLTADMLSAYTGGPLVLGLVSGAGRWLIPPTL